MKKSMTAITLAALMLPLTGCVEAAYVLAGLETYTAARQKMCGGELLITCAQRSLTTKAADKDDVLARFRAGDAQATADVLKAVQDIQATAKALEALRSDEKQE